MSPEARILEPGQMEEAPIGEIPFLFLPGRDLFARRAGRLRFLGDGHTLGGYLGFLAMIAEAQQSALESFPAVVLPGPDEQAHCEEQRRPLLDVCSLHRDPAWRLGLGMILRNMSEAPLPEAARDAVVILMRAGENAWEETAERILAGDLAGVSPQELPFVAAALQAWWVHRASYLREDVIRQEASGKGQEGSRVRGQGSILGQGGLCPVCGSYPNVGIIRTGGAEHGLRYLSCSLCSSQWHMVRIKCSKCESTGRMDYHILEGSSGAIKAESCGDCNFYLKLLYLEKDHQMDVTADDLASLSLDLLMDKEGKTRGGPNLLFHPGRW